MPPVGRIQRAGNLNPNRERVFDLQSGERRDLPQLAGATPEKLLDPGMHSRVDTRVVKRDTLGSGELAKATGLSADTIRHYERLGVLPKAERTMSGYRVYPEATLERVGIVQRALRIGFTLAELADIFKTRDTGGAPCQRVFELAQQKLAGIRTDIVALKRTERYMEKVLKDWKIRVGRTGRGQKAHLLQSLTDAVKDVPQRKFGRRR